MIEDFEKRAVSPEQMYWYSISKEQNPPYYPEEISFAGSDGLLTDGFTRFVRLCLDHSDFPEYRIVPWPEDYYQRDIETRKELTESGEIDGNN